MRSILIIGLAVILSATFAVGEESADDDMCMPLSSITALSLQPGMTQTRRRTANVPTLNCVGNCPANAFVSGAQCTQTGMSDNGLPSWKCKGTFPGATSRDRYALGSIRVQCEGCKKAGDPRVVKGSCALTYSVQSRHLSRRGAAYPQRTSDEMTAGDYIMLALIIGSLVACCYCAAKKRGQADYTTYEGVPIGPDGKPIPGAAGGVHHHHHHGGGYGGGGGFGTGMFTGFLMGDMMGRMSSYGHGGYGGGYGGGYDDDGFGGGGGDSWGGDGGFGGTDSV